MESRALSPELLGFQLHCVTSGGRGSITVVNSAAGGVSGQQTGPLLSLHSSVACLSLLAGSSGFSLSSSHGYRCFPTTPEQKTNKQKTSETLKLWLNSIDLKKKRQKKQRNQQNQKKYLFCHKGWNFIVLQV